MGVGCAIPESCAHFKPTLKLAEIPLDFRLYDLRHSCASLLLAAGLNIKVVSERLGHANIKMTLETYTHVLPGGRGKYSNGADAL